MQQNLFFESYRIKIIQQLGLTAVMEALRDNIESFIAKKVAELGVIKVQLSVFDFVLKTVEDTEIKCHASSNSKTVFAKLANDEFLKLLIKWLARYSFCRSDTGFIVKTLENFQNRQIQAPTKGKQFSSFPNGFQKQSFAHKHPKQ